MAYIDILGHPTWVSDDGSSGSPVLLLHGGLLSSETSWADLPGRLGGRHRVVMFDRRGHGRTADTPAPFHYSAMADETAGVIETLKLAPVDVVGYSDGANLLLHLALARPELLRSIVLISGNYHHDALHPEVIAMLNGVVANEPFAAAFAERSPDGAAHWPVVVEKGLKMGAREEPTFTPADLRRITTPTLVIAGDDDMFSVAHTASMYDALPDAQLAIIPGSSHWVVAEKTALVAEMIQAFLESPGRPATMVPVKRRPS